MSAAKRVILEGAYLVPFEQMADPVAPQGDFLQKGCDAIVDAQPVPHRPESADRLSAT